jgi:hypothetical protein
LSALDIKEDMVVGFQDGNYGVGVIRATVFAVAQSDRYIFAKQHPRTSGYRIDRTITNYYIIPLKNKINVSPEKNVLGPYDHIAFNKCLDSLGIDEVQFEIVFEELDK